VTQQDRWEEDAGYSPFTLAVEISGLLAAADLADAVGEKDVATYLRETAARYDIVAMDLTDPVGPSLELYSPETFALAKRAMAPGAALTLHIGSPISHPERVRLTLDNLRRVFKRVTPYFAHIPLYGSTWGFACASDTLDPRAPHLRAMGVKLAEKIGEAKWIRMSERIAQLMKEKKNLNANVDFYSGIMYQAMGFKPEMFTVLFAIPRTIGWLTQWQEMLTDPEQKIARPRQVWIGHETREFVPMDKRGK